MSSPSRTRASSSSRLIGTAPALKAPWPWVPRSEAGELIETSGWRCLRSILSSQYHWLASVDTPIPGTPWRSVLPGGAAARFGSSERIRITSFTVRGVLRDALQLELQDVVA